MVLVLVGNIEVKQKIRDNKNSINVIWFGISLGFGYWIFESIVHTYVLKEGSLIEEIFFPLPYKIGMRVVITCLIIIFGIYAQTVIAKYKRAGEKSHQQNRLFRNAIDSLTHPFYLIDANNYKVILANRISGFGRALNNQTCYALTHKSDRPCSDADHPCPLEQVKATGKPAMVEHIYYDRNGAAIYLEIHAYPIFDSNGKVIQIIENSIDVTDQISARLELRASEKRFQDIVLSLTDWIWEIDHNGRFTFAFGNVREILGYDPEELIGKTPFDLMPEDEIKRIEKIFNDLISEKKQINNLKNWNLTKKGEKVCLLTNGVPVLDNDGVLTGYRGVDRDITKLEQAEVQRKKLTEELERAKRMESLAVLAGGVAHDLNNLLGPMVGYPELILSKLPDDSPHRKNLTRIAKSAEKASEIVQDLLALARRGRYTMKSIDLNHIIEEYLDLPTFIGLKADNPNVKIEMKLDNCIPKIFGSSTHLLKALMNLIVNAFDAMPGGGKLAITTSRQYVEKLKNGYEDIENRDYVLLSIQDTGEGIEAKDIQRIFEPYFSKKEMGQKSGSGLGLSVVYGIIKDHNGYYDIVSKANEGTEFILYFPILNDIVEKNSDTEQITVME